MKNREEIANGYTDGEGGLAPLSWGRLKIASRVFDGELGNEEGAAIAAALYLLPIHKLKGLPKDTAELISVCEVYADSLEASQVLRCVKALERDMAAIEASQMEPDASGKNQAVERSPSAMPPLEPLPSA
jgi:hypothetical protein